MAKNRRRTVSVPANAITFPIVEGCGVILNGLN